MQIIHVKFIQQEYDIQIASGLLEQLSKTIIDMGFKNKVVIITNPFLKKLYADRLGLTLNNDGFEPSILEVPDGERFKSLEWAGKLYNRLADLKVERLTPIMAMGGGVIGDLAGFVAATYMRGVPLIQIPTTLLAQVDSSIGGKVAVNHGRLKNNVGTFYQPKLVSGDISVLKTLPEDQIENGLAEIIKYGIVKDRELFKIIDNNLEELKSLEEKITERVISRCAAIKAEIVEKDEKDLGLRNILNLGHTTGHAIETVSGFKVGHGYGVSMGMVAAGAISHKMGVLEAVEFDQIKSLLNRAGLPVKIAGLDSEKIIEAMKHDKKNTGGKIKFILPRAIGEVFVSDNVSTDLVKQVLKEMYEETQDMRHNRR
jgi:3-dehydroquinate synthase